MYNFFVKMYKLVGGGIAMPVVIIAIIITGWIIFLKSKKYRKTSYYNLTHNSYLKTKFYKKIRDTYQMYSLIQHYEYLGAKFLFHLQVPREQGEQYDVDMLMIHSQGVFLFDLKKYKNYILGDEKQIYWTEQLHSFFHGNRKTSFVNPTLKLKSLIKWMQKKELNPMPIFGILVFPKQTDCSLVQILSSQIQATPMEDLPVLVQSHVSQKTDVLTEEEVLTLYHLFSVYASKYYVDNLILNYPMNQVKPSNIVPFHEVREK